MIRKFLHLRETIELSSCETTACGLYIDHGEVLVASYWKEYLGITHEDEDYHIQFQTCEECIKSPQAQFKLLAEVKL